MQWALLVQDGARAHCYIGCTASLPVTRAYGLGTSPTHEGMHCRLINVNSLMLMGKQGAKAESIPAGVGEATGEGLGRGTGESAAASGGVLLNSAYFISELSVAGPLDAFTASPPIAAPASTAALVRTCTEFPVRRSHKINTSSLSTGAGQASHNLASQDKTTSLRMPASGAPQTDRRQTGYNKMPMQSDLSCWCSEWPAGHMSRQQGLSLCSALP